MVFATCVIKLLNNTWNSKIEIKNDNKTKL